MGHGRTAIIGDVWPRQLWLAIAPTQKPWRRTRFVISLRTIFAAIVLTAASLPLIARAQDEMRIIRIWTTAHVTPGDGRLMNVFTIDGVSSKRVLLRAIKGSLADPHLALHDSTTGRFMNENDDWKQSQFDAIRATGRAPTHDEDAAILTMLDPGTYTAVVSGGSGSVLADVFDLDGAEPESVFTAVGSRGISDPDVPLFATVEAAGSDGEILIRALGPSLPLAGTVQDPVLTSGSRTNDNWKETEAQAIRNTGLAPSRDQESALLASPSRGQLKASVSAKDGTRGIAFLQFYSLPFYGAALPHDPLPTSSPGATPTPTPSATPSPTPTPAATSKPLNLSTRIRVGTGDNVLIGGFINDGDSKNVVVRALGPSLTSAAVAGYLDDPVVELHMAGGGLVATNDDWRQGSAAQQIEALGLAPTHDRESAMKLQLSRGSYTAIVRGTNGGTGVGLVELYDLDRPEPARLANISTRGSVGTSEDVMIGGFVLGDGGGGRVLLRAIGPSLAKKGIAGALMDPLLALHDAQGSLVISNDDWQTSANADEIRATTIAPADDRESAILTTLQPGAYTAIVRGQSSTTGVALVELYSLP